MSPREHEYEEKGVTIVAVNAFEDPAVGRAFMESGELDYTWAFADAETTEALGVATVPTQVLIDRDGKVVWTSSFTSLMGGADAVFEAIDAAL